MNRLRVIIQRIRKFFQRETKPKLWECHTATVNGRESYTEYIYQDTNPGANHRYDNDGNPISVFCTQVKDKK